MAHAGKGGEGKQAPVVREGQLMRYSPFEEMDRMLESFFPQGWLRQFRAPWEMAEAETRFPRVDIVDRDDDILLRAAIPGVRRQDLEISVTENTITLKGSAGREEEEEKGSYYRHEILHGAFVRTVSLPSDIDTDKTQAKFNEGILEITMPKVSKAKRRTISVS